MNSHQVGRAGEHYVAAEIHRRGGYATTFAGNMPDIDLLATDALQTKSIRIQVKTRSSGTWQVHPSKCKPPGYKDGFWVFVDLSHKDGIPEFYIVPDPWIRDSITKRHDAYMKEWNKTHKGQTRADHSAIKPVDIAQWKGRWDKLGLGLE